VKIHEKALPGLEDSFLTVRHTSIRGTNREIGRALAAIAVERHGLSPDELAVADETITRARRTYFAGRFPILMERAGGAAQKLGLDPEDECFDTAGLPYNFDIPPENAGPSAVHGCSTVYYPPGSTSTGRGCLSRNYDFPKGSLYDISGIDPPDGSSPPRSLMSDPYILELHPSDGGYASIAVTCFDLLSGALEGINSEGLVVALNGDEIAAADMEAGSLAPGLPRVGLHELECVRLLLDTCATAFEAKEALAKNRHYPIFMPSHYMIADRFGASFVFEYSFEDEKEFFIEGSGEIQAVFNHPLRIFDSPDTFPGGSMFTDVPTSSFERSRIFTGMLASGTKPFDAEAVRRMADEVAVSRVVARIPPELRSLITASSGLARTLWHSLYDQESRRIEIRFFTGDAPDDEGGFLERYTDYNDFTLDG